MFFWKNQLNLRQKLLLMKKKEQKISLFISVILAAVIFTAMSVVCQDGLAGSTVNLLRVFFPLVSGVVLFFVLIKIFNKIVAEQVKPIYGTLETFSKPEEEFKIKSVSDDTNKIVAQVNEEVAKWVKDKAKEISILKSNEKYRKEYLGNVSHELKTPLFNIQGYITTLMDGGLDDPEINVKYLQRAEKNINRLISIVQDLETISKLETGNLKLVIENFDVTDTIKEVFELNELKAENKKIQLKMVQKAKTQSVMAAADKMRIYEVINNLVVNSINYGKEGGTTSVGIFDIDNKWLIEVQDDGIGISEENLQRVFERFFRVDKSRSSQNGGTGLGLAIVKHILEAHGEGITVKSRINEGTTFSFTLKKAKI